ncbi:MAG: flagellar motor switch protein FliN [Spirochaetaceae bacterium]|jgi:flagellar motor switch protein FliN/FliY|nr:flagellar motor switch protein FliN [Spirochaetaceae bacterium]
MSDSALSQAEIDALLAPGGKASGGGPDDSIPENTADAGALEAFLGGTVASLSANLSAMTGGSVAFSTPKVGNKERDAFLGDLPNMVTVVKVDFTSGFPGEHIFLIPEETAKSIASLMNKEENIALDDMAMSVVGEAVSQITGTLITALTGKTGNKSIASAPPEAANIPKATAALPAGAFTVAAFELDLGDGKKQPIWEIFGPSVASGISAALTAGAAPSAAPGGKAGAAPAGGGAPSGGVVGGGGFGAPPNMQSVQYPNLSSTNAPREQGNIGLLMDVSMEMTVELGRARKQIKEILSMGEGTIIELDKLAGEPVDILVNHKLIAKGEVVVIDESFGVRVTEIVSPSERMPNVN